MRYRQIIVAVGIGNIYTLGTQKTAGSTNYNDVCTLSRPAVLLVFLSHLYEPPVFGAKVLVIIVQNKSVTNSSICRAVPGRGCCAQITARGNAHELPILHPLWYVHATQPWEQRMCTTTTGHAHMEHNPRTQQAAHGDTQPLHTHTLPTGQLRAAKLDRRIRSVAAVRSPPPFTACLLTHFLHTSCGLPTAYVQSDL